MLPELTESGNSGEREHIHVNKWVIPSQGEKFLRGKGGNRWG